MTLEEAVFAAADSLSQARAVMTPLEAALGYAGRGWPVFPCHSEGPRRKRPYVAGGFHTATRDPAILNAWWRQWPTALVGVPTGGAAGFVVFDVDVKDPRADGFDTLEDLGIALPDTPIAHTASGGVHCYFANPDRELKNSAGLIGPGLDVRADGGYVIIPSPDSGYYWDPVLNFDTCQPVAAPPWLWPVKLSRPIETGPIKPVTGLSPYGEAAINFACNAIMCAGPGRQEATLNSESFSLGTLAGAGGVPSDLALRALMRAAARMPDHDPAWPWRPEEIDLKVRRAFEAGMKHPRTTGGRHGTA